MKPHFVIGKEPNAYMYRWYIIKSKMFCIYLHKILKSDDDRALHDHRSDNISIILKGSYIEHTTEGKKVRRPFVPVFRKAEKLHRLELSQPVWSLFIKFRERREWGFMDEKLGWVKWDEYEKVEP
jgi:hypothetical protein